MQIVKSTRYLEELEIMLGFIAEDSLVELYNLQIL